MWNYFEFEPVVQQDMSFKDISYRELWLQSWTICAILGKGNYEEQFCDFFFQLGPAVQEGMPLKDISYLELWQHLRSIEGNHLSNFGRRHQEEKICEMVLNLNSGSGDVA